MAVGRYPKAQWKGDGQSGGGYDGRPYRVVLHTTETRGVPGYADGKSAPHLTYMPVTRQWVQHSLLVTASRALRNEAGGVQTNRANALQIEIVCYSAKTIADTVGGLWVGNLPTTAYTDLGQFVVWAGEVFGVKPVWPGRQAFTYAQANTAGFRMTPNEWLSFNGVCGHQHVPENRHWDPGALDWGRLFPQPPPDDEEELDMTYKEIREAIVAGITDRQIDRLFDQGVAKGSRDYFKKPAPDGIRDMPGHGDWDNLVRAILVAKYVNQAGATV